MESNNKHVAQECEDLKIKVKNVLNSEHQKDVEGWLEANKVLFLYFGSDLVADASDEIIREEFDAWLAVVTDYDYDIDEYKCEVEDSQRIVDNYQRSFDELGKALFADDEIPS